MARTSPTVNGAAPGGGGGGTAETGLWNPLVAQDPLHAKTDYFDDASLAGKWTEWDADSVLTVTETAATRLKLALPNAAAFAMAGIKQTAPAATQYAITAQIRVQSVLAGDTCLGGVFVAGDIGTNPSTAACFYAGITYRASDIDVEVTSCSNYATLTTAHKSQDDWGWNVEFVRIFVDTVANTYSVLFSTDGMVWTMVAVVTQAASTVTSDPAYIGIFANSIATGYDMAVFSTMFRVDETSDAYLPCGEWA